MLCMLQLYTFIYIFVREFSLTRRCRVPDLFYKGLFLVCDVYVSPRPFLLFLFFFLFIFALLIQASFFISIIYIIIAIIILH